MSRLAKPVLLPGDVLAPDAALSLAQRHHLHSFYLISELTRKKSPFCQTRVAKSPPPPSDTATLTPQAGIFRDIFGFVLRGIPLYVSAGDVLAPDGALPLARRDLRHQGPGRD